MRYLTSLHLSKQMGGQSRGYFPPLQWTVLGIFAPLPMIRSSLSARTSYISEYLLTAFLLRFSHRNCSISTTKGHDRGNDESEGHYGLIRRVVTRRMVTRRCGVFSSGEEVVNPSRRGAIGTKGRGPGYSSSPLAETKGGAPLDNL